VTGEVVSLVSESSWTGSIRYEIEKNTLRDPKKKRALTGRTKRFSKAIYRRAQTQVKGRESQEISGYSVKALTRID